VRLPGTTLAQNDSGVGIKNGINAFGKKNFIGTFAVPFAVVNDFGLLASLSPREKRVCFEYQTGFKYKDTGRTLYLADFDVEKRAITNAKPFANEKAQWALDCAQGEHALEQPDFIVAAGEVEIAPGVLDVVLGVERPGPDVEERADGGGARRREGVQVDPRIVRNGVWPPTLRAATSTSTRA
jgi:hypothetical protein